MLFPDIIWINQPDAWASAEGGYGDYAYAGDDEPGNAGGLQANNTLHTAILIQLFTDRRAREEMDIDGNDPRGWAGDSFDVREDQHEREMGSYLWTLERGQLSEETERLAEEYTLEALQVIIDQGAVASFEADAKAQPATGILELSVRGFSHMGKNVYDQHFQVLWQQIADTVV